MERLNSTAGALLGFLRNGPRSGYDLVAEAERTIGAFWTVTRSQVYRELDDLERRSLIERGELGQRRRQPFRITEAGQRAFREWVNTDPEPENLRIPLLLRLTFADEVEPDRLRAILASHRAVHARRLADYLRLDQELAIAGLPPGHRLPLAFGIAYETAALGWFDALPEQLRPAGTTA